MKKCNRKSTIKDVLKDATILESIDPENQTESNESKREEAAMKLFQLYEELCDKFPGLKYWTTLDEVCPILSKYYGVNIIIHRIFSNDHIMCMYPEKYEPDLPRVDLLQSPTDNEDIFHISCLKYLMKYEGDFGAVCPFCKKLTKGRYYQHQCKMMPTCNMCSKIQSQEALIYSSTKWMFCDTPPDNGCAFAIRQKTDVTELNKAGSFECSSCNGEFNSNFCFKWHKKVCSRTIWCKNCDIRLKVNGSNKKEELLSDHDCLNVQRFCTFCKRTHPKDESCRMFFKQVKKMQPKLCVLAWSQNGKEDCYQCSFDDSVCTAHHNISDNNFDKGGFLISAREKGTYGNIIFEEYNDQCNALIVDEMDFPNILYGKKPTLDILQTTNFKIDEAQKNTEFTKQFMAKTPIQKFVKKALTDNTFRNTIILTHGEILSDLYVAVRSAGQNVSDVKMDGNIIGRFRVSFNNITVTNIDNFMTEKFSTSRLKCTKSSCNDCKNGICKVYFPNQHYKKTCYEENNEIQVDVTAFYSSFDSSDDMEKKKYFWSRNKVLNFKADMRKYLKFQANELLNIVREIYAFAFDMFNFLQKCNQFSGLTTVLNPFEWTTFCGFMYYMMTECCLSTNSNVFAVKHGERGVPIENCSNEEFRVQMAIKIIRTGAILFASYLSAMGARKWIKNNRGKVTQFPIPDVYDARSKTATFYDGCW